MASCPTLADTSGTVDTVVSSIAKQNQFAAQAFEGAEEAIAAIGSNLDGLIANANISYDAQNPNLSFPNANIPTVPGGSISISTSAGYNPSTIVPPSVGVAPTFTKEAPAISPGARPDALTATQPGDAPVIETDFVFPDAPTTSLPAVPTFETLNIPTAPVITIPVFDLDLPVNTAIPPGVTFSYIEEEYGSDLLTALKTELLDRIQNGGTGLNPSVEQSIFDRGRNREDIGSTKTTREIDTEQASRGFRRPTGSHLAALDQAAQDAQSQIAALSRDIMIKQADLEQKNIEFAIQTSAALEGTLINLHNSVQQRKFEVAQYIQDVAIAIYNAQVSAYQAELSAYQAFSQAFEAQVRAQLAQVDIFRSEIEAERLKGTINQQRVDLYNAQLTGIRTEVDIYSTNIQAVAQQIQAEGLKVENYKSVVEAYAALVGAKRDEFAAYGESVRAETAKVGAYEAETRAFAARVQGYAAGVDASISSSKNDIAIEDIRLRAHLADLETNVKNAQIKLQERQAELSAFSSEVSAATLQIQQNTASADVEGKSLQLAIQDSKNQADVQIAAAQVGIENARLSASIVTGAQNAAAQASAGLAQAALNAVDVGASISSGLGQDFNYSYSCD